MTPVAAAEHFAGDPEWTWYILAYFFLAGLAGGSYFLAAFLRHWGTPADEPAARLGFYVALPATLICPILLTLDLTKPLRFWHMLVNTTPGNFGLNFNSGTPMSVGVWMLLLASVFAGLELLLLAVLVLTLIDDGTLDEAFDLPWIPLWLLALAGMLPGLSALAGRRLRVTADGAVAVERAKAWTFAPALVLAGVLALRTAVIFSAQA